MFDVDRVLGAICLMPVLLLLFCSKMLSLIIREFDGEKIEFSDWIMSVSEEPWLRSRK